MCFWSLEQLILSGTDAGRYFSLYKLRTWAVECVLTGKVGFGEGVSGAMTECVWVFASETDFRVDFILLYRRFL